MGARAAPVHGEHLAMQPRAGGSAASGGGSQGPRVASRGQRRTPRKRRACLLLGSPQYAASKPHPVAPGTLWSWSL